MIPAVLTYSEGFEKTTQMADAAQIDIEDGNDLTSRVEQRNLLLKDIDQKVLRRAWFTLSHLLLTDGAKVVDMGCDDGAMTYTMAVLNPKLKFVGVEKNKRQINKAKEKFQLHNLEFIAGDTTTELFPPESVDAIINSFILHEVYSNSRYNERIVNDTLETHFKMLKKDGLMFIRDYSRPPPEEFVLMEMPDAPSHGNELSKLSEADLLVWYAEHARPKQDAGCGGFFLEELPSRFPKTRLFHLPFKWAYEFIMRKDDRAMWEKELPMEYTFFTPREFRKGLRALGARVQYSGPHWDEELIEENFEGRFRLFQPDGTPLGHPPTSYIAVARKLSERKSLHIEERRPSAPPENSPIKISAMRDVKTGEILDIVSRNVTISEIIPYRVDEHGQLKVYLHDGITRSVVNAVPRNGVNFDGRRWSAHMVEAISVDGTAMATMEEFDVKHTVRFARDYLGLKPKDNAILTKGPDYYPSPDYIDDRIYTYYLSVEQAQKAITPKSHGAYSHRYQAKGEVREIDAQQVLNAISVGMIPNAQLELQILMLFEHLGIKAENWTTKQIKFKAGKIKQKTSLKKLLKNYKIEDSRFKNVKGTAGQVRPVHSVFVEQGQTRGAMTGLSSEDVDFVVRDDQTINTAVVLPLTMGLKRDIHAGIQLKHLPIPQRHEGNATTIAAPSFNLPPGIVNLQMAKKFIAEQFGVLPSMVIKLGESYFSHIGVTPHRIHPFAVNIPEGTPDDPLTKFLPFYQLKLLRRSLSKDTHLMVVIARAYKYLNEEIKLDFNHRVKAVVKARLDKVQQDWALPLNYEPSPLVRRPSVIEPVAAEPKTTLIEKLQPKSEPKQEPVSEPIYAQDELNEEQIDELEQELEEFIETMEQYENIKPQAPQPEKW